MISCLDDTAGGSEHGILEDFALKLRKHSAKAKAELEKIASMDNGPQVYRILRNSGEIPTEVALIMRVLEPELFERLEGQPA